MLSNQKIHLTLVLPPSFQSQRSPEKKFFPKNLPPTKQNICHNSCHIISHWTRIPVLLPRNIKTEHPLVQTYHNHGNIKTSFTMRIDNTKQPIFRKMTSSPTDFTHQQYQNSFRHQRRQESTQYWPQIQKPNVTNIMMPWYKSSSPRASKT